MDSFIGIFSKYFFLFLKIMKFGCFMGVQKYMVPQKLPILGDCADGITQPIFELRLSFFAWTLL